MGIWPGGHCIDDMAGTPHIAAMAARPTAGAGNVVTAASALTVSTGHSGTLNNDAGHTQHRPDTPNTTAGDCRVGPAPAVGTTVNVAVHPPQSGRAPLPAPHPRMQQQRLLPAVALAEIGVWRT